MHLQSNPWFELESISISRERGIGDDYIALVQRRQGTQERGRVQLTLAPTGRGKRCCDCGKRIDSTSTRCGRCHKEYQQSKLKQSKLGKSRICPQCGRSKYYRSKVCSICYTGMRG